MNMHKFFHRVGFAIVSALGFGALTYLMSVGILLPLLSLGRSPAENPIMIGLGVGAFFFVLTLVFSMVIGTPFDDTLIIKKKS